MATIRKKKTKTSTQLSLTFKPKKKRKKAVKSVTKITNKGLLRARITTQNKTITKLKKKIATEVKKENVFKKNLQFR